MTIGERIKAIRVALDLTVEELAESVGIDSTVISSYEEDNAEPGFTFLSQLTIKHHINLKYLFNGEGAAFDRKAGTEEEYKAKMLRSLYPGLMDNPIIDKFIESMQVPIIGYTVIQQYLVFREAFTPHIENYFKGTDNKPA